jgi:hypothetical protein
MLIVETGLIIANADSFVSLVDARSQADLLGLSLPVDDTEAEQALRNGARYVNSQEPSLQGYRVSIDQTMCEPRIGATKHGFIIPDNVVPNEAICAQIYAASAITEGSNPYAVDNGKETKLEEVSGAVKVEYFESGSTESSVRITGALDCLYPITTDAVSGGSMFQVPARRG